MNEHFISRAEAESDLLACAGYIAESITGGEAQAAAMSPVVAAYLERGNVDLAAELANSVDDPFTRDRLLIAVASKCAESNDYEYAIQLVEAIEEPGFQAQGLERIGLIKADSGDTAKAREVAALMAHPDRVLAAVAIKEANEGDTAGAFATVDEIGYPGSAVVALKAIAAKNVGTEAFVTIVDRSIREAGSIELDEERIGAYVGIGELLIETDNKARAIEVLKKARSEAEELESVYYDSLLAHISLSFLNCGEPDLADNTLDLIGDKTQIASVLLGFSRDYWRKEEKDQAFEALEEAYAILKSQRDTETRDSKAKFALFSQIAVQFAGFEKGERALEIAERIEDADQKTAAFSQIAQISTVQGRDELARQALNLITDDGDRMFALIGMSDAAAKNDPTRAEEILDEAFQLLPRVPQTSLQASAMTALGERYSTLGSSEKAHSMVSKVIELLSEMRSQRGRVSALCDLSILVEGNGLVLNEDDKNGMKSLLVIPVM